MNKIFKPLECPFTRAVVFDEDGYASSFPETLLYYHVDEDVFKYKELEILKEIEYIADNVSDLLSQHKTLFLKTFKKEYNWFRDFNEWMPMDLLCNHPLVKTINDNNDYSNAFLEGLTIFCFARKQDIPTVINDFNLVSQSLNNMEKLLEVTGIVDLENVCKNLKEIIAVIRVKPGKKLGYCM